MEPITVCSAEQQPIHNHKKGSSTTPTFNDTLSLWKKRTASNSRDQDQDVTSVTASDSSLDGINNSDEEEMDLVSARAMKSLPDGGCAQEEAKEKVETGMFCEEFSSFWCSWCLPSSHSDTIVISDTEESSASHIPTSCSEEEPIEHPFSPTESASEREPLVEIAEQKPPADTSTVDEMNSMIQVNVEGTTEEIEQFPLRPKVKENDNEVEIHPEQMDILDVDKDIENENEGNLLEEATVEELSVFEEGSKIASFDHDQEARIVDKSEEPMHSEEAEVLSEEAKMEELPLVAEEPKIADYENEGIKHSEEIAEELRIAEETVPLEEVNLEENMFMDAEEEMFMDAEEDNVVDYDYDAGMKPAFENVEDTMHSNDIVLLEEQEDEVEESSLVAELAKIVHFDEGTKLVNENSKETKIFEESALLENVRMEEKADDLVEEDKVANEIEFVEVSKESQEAMLTVVVKLVKEVKLAKQLQHAEQTKRLHRKMTRLAREIEITKAMKAVGEEKLAQKAKLKEIKAKMKLAKAKMREMAKLAEIRN